VLEQSASAGDADYEVWVFEAPSFRLYEDGRVVFRVMPDGDRIPPYWIAQLTEEQRDELVQFALRDGGLGAAGGKYPGDVPGTVTFKLDSPIAKVVVTYGQVSVPATGQEAIDREKFDHLAATLASFDGWLAGRGIPSRPYVPQAYIGGLVRFPADSAAEPALPGLTPSAFRPGVTIPVALVSPELAKAIAKDPTAGAIVERRFVDPLGGSFGVLLRPLLPGDAIA
jgi:hypothetical protein